MIAPVHYSTEQETPMWRLYHHEYHHVYIRKLYTMDPSDVEYSGIYNHDDLDQVILCKLSAAKLADVLGKGGGFVFKTPEVSAKSIYRCIIELFRHIEFSMMDPNGAGKLPSFTDRNELSTLVEECNRVANCFDTCVEDKSAYQNYVSSMTFGMNAKPANTGKRKVPVNQTPVSKTDRILLTGIEEALATGGF